MPGQPNSLELSDAIEPVSTEQPSLPTSEAPWCFLDTFSFLDLDPVLVIGPKHINKNISSLSGSVVYTTAYYTGREKGRSTKLSDLSLPI